MKNATKGKILKTSALTLDVGAPLLATLSQFPLWVEKSSAATVSGLFLVLALVSVIPFIKYIKQWLKSPSVFILWCVFLVLFIALRNIIDQMVIICLIGAIGNGLGALLYKSGTNLEAKPDDVVSDDDDNNEV